MQKEAVLQEIAAKLSGCKRWLFITGAGLSADSGLPTYRGKGGLYDNRDTDDDMPIEQALSGEMLKRDPSIMWQHIGQIEQACRQAKHNAAYAAIAALDDHYDITVLTQNIDGFHKQAGSKQVIEMHGTIRRIRCIGCDQSSEVRDYSALSLPPYCNECGSLIRPDVVLFGEMLPEVALYRWYRACEVPFDVVFSVGTTSVFPYIAQPVVEAAQQGRLTIEINPATTPVSEWVDYQLPYKAVEVLPALLELLNVDDG